MTYRKSFLLPALLVLSISFIFASCNKKKRKAEFILTQYEYGAGDALKYQNLTEKFDSCYWEIIDPTGEKQQTFTGSHPNLLTDIISLNGLYTLRLTTLNRKEKVISTTEKEFMIKSYRQILRVNGISGAQGTQQVYDVYVDYQYIGKANSQGIYNNSNIPAGWRYVELIAPSEKKSGLYQFEDSGYSPVDIEF